MLVCELTEDPETIPVMVVPWVTEVIAAVEVDIEIEPEDVSPVDEEGGSMVDVCEEGDSDALEVAVGKDVETELDSGIPARTFS